jgi:HEPN domain-containing protein
MQNESYLEDSRVWIRYAEADIALASIPLPENGMYEQLCFHAQQAAEKAIKGVLVSQGITPPKTHDIELLITLLPTSISRANLPSKAAKLSGYASNFRYPGEEIPVTRDDYLILLAIARDTLAWAVASIEKNEA